MSVESSGELTFSLSEDRCAAEVVAPVAQVRATSFLGNLNALVLSPSLVTDPIHFPIINGDPE